MRKQIERKFSKEVTEDQDVVLELGYYAVHIRWVNGERKEISVREEKGGRDSVPHDLFYKYFKSVSEIEDLRDLLTSMLEELQEVPED